MSCFFTFSEINNFGLKIIKVNIKLKKLKSSFQNSLRWGGGDIPGYLPPLYQTVCYC